MACFDVLSENIILSRLLSRLEVGYVKVCQPTIDMDFKSPIFTLKLYHKYFQWKSRYSRLENNAYRKFLKKPGTYTENGILADCPDSGGNRLSHERFRTSRL